MKREYVDYETAIEMLPKGDEVHTFRSTRGILIGADWKRKQLLTCMKKYEKTLEIPGEQAKAFKHGLVLQDENGNLFIKTV